MDTMRRVEVVDDGDFASEIFYIHKNAVHHQYVASIEEWKWSFTTKQISNNIVEK